MPRSTMSVEPATQACPALPRMLLATEAAALIQIAVYCGISRRSGGFRVARRVREEMAKEEPAAS